MRLTDRGASVKLFDSCRHLCPAHDKKLEESELGYSQATESFFTLALYSGLLPIGEDLVHQLVDKCDDPIIHRYALVDVDLELIRNNIPLGLTELVRVGFILLGGNLFSQNYLIAGVHQGVF